MLPEPPKSEKPDQYVYDPAKVKLPEETDSTIVKIPGDKKDLLVYKTEQLKEALDIVGPIELELKHAVVKCYVTPLAGLCRHRVSG